MPLQHLLPCLNQWGNPLNTKPFFYIWKHNRHLTKVPFRTKVSIWVKILCQLGFWLCRLRCTGCALSVLLSWKLGAIFFSWGLTNTELANMMQKFAPHNSKSAFDCQGKYLMPLGPSIWVNFSPPNRGPDVHVTSLPLCCCRPFTWMQWW